jgi:hypothetical protein
MTEAIRAKNFKMKNLLLLCLLSVWSLVWQTAWSSPAPELNGIHSNQDLATYIMKMTADRSNWKPLLIGLDSTNSITVDSNTVVPVREIIGTIVEERFQADLPKHFYKAGKKYNVRIICSCLDQDGLVNRFHVVIYETRQYQSMKQMVRGKMPASKVSKG